jgi:hypothetical protein
MKDPRPYTAKVSVKEATPDADQIVKLLTEEPARLPGAIRRLIKPTARLLEVRESRRRAIGEFVNEPKQQRAQRRKSIGLEIADRLIRKEPRRRSHTSELARLIRAAWPTKETPTPGLRTIRRWLTEK